MLELHKIALCICIASCLSVVGVMIYTIFDHRRAELKNSGHFHQSMLTEVLWAAIPILILIGMAAPTTITIW